MNQFELGWVVGLFEGEGCIALGNRNLTLASTDLDVLEHFRKTVGFGSITEIPKQKPHHKQAWLWQSGRWSDTSSFLKNILPHLGKRRARKAQEFLASTPASQWGPNDKKSCVHGHDWTISKNVRIYTDHEGKLRRRCRPCDREYHKKRKR